MKTLEEQIECAHRELAMRKNVYPSRVVTKRMKPEQAKHETECMAAIIETLTGLRDKELF